MTPAEYKRCEYCERFRNRTGEYGDCMAAQPSAADQLHPWPKVSPLDYCEAGFRFDAAILLDRLGKLDAKLTGELNRVAELELEMDAVQAENERLVTLLGGAVERRVPLAMAEVQPQTQGVGDERECAATAG